MDLFMARQPIFDLDQKVFGYEMLYRSGFESSFPGVDGDVASAGVINHSFYSITAEELNGGKRAFINFSRELLLSEIAFVLPKNILVVEILETVEIDDKVVDLCRRLKQEGYLIALDDFVYSKSSDLVMPYVDIVKIDFMATSRMERLRLVEKCSRYPVKLLAEKVETNRVVEEAKNLGCEYFQGYFFSKPVVIYGKAMSSSQIASVRLLAEVNNNDPDPEKIRRIVEMEIGLTYKLLRYINSTAFGIRHKVNSIDHAIRMMGTRELSRWITLVAMKGMLDGKPEELVTTAAIRAKFCELAAQKTHMQSDGTKLFMVGLFSLVDAMLWQPLAEILQALPFDEKIKATLLGEENKFRQVLNIILAYERGDWRRVNELAVLLGMEEKDVATCYRDAVAWASGHGG